MTLSWPVVRVGVIDSTNTEARRRAAAGDFSDQWIVADAQTAGRGRRDKVWASPAGNIFATALFVEPAGIAVALRVPFAAALAVADTVKTFAPKADVRLKWPNDVRVLQQKVSGILIETGGTDAEFWIAAGIGLNVGYAPENVGQATTCLDHLSGRKLDIAEVMGVLQAAFEMRLCQARAGFETLRSDWLELAEGLHGSILVTVADQSIQGIFEDLEADGALRLRLPDGAARIIRAGEVNLIGRT